jgi:hypothetical protein
MAMMPYGWSGHRRRSQDMQTSGTPQVIAAGQEHGAVLTPHRCLAPDNGWLRPATWTIRRS